MKFRTGYFSVSIGKFSGLKDGDDEGWDVGLVGSEDG